MKMGTMSNKSRRDWMYAVSWQDISTHVHFIDYYYADHKIQATQHGPCM